MAAPRGRGPVTGAEGAAGGVATMAAPLIALLSPKCESVGTAWLAA